MYSDMFVRVQPNFRLMNESDQPPSEVGKPREMYHNKEFSTHISNKKLGFSSENNVEVVVWAAQHNITNLECCNLIHSCSLPLTSVSELGRRIHSLIRCVDQLAINCDFSISKSVLQTLAENA